MHFFYSHAARIVLLFCALNYIISGTMFLFLIRNDNVISMTYLAPIILSIGATFNTMVLAYMYIKVHADVNSKLVKLKMLRDVVDSEKEVDSSKTNKIRRHEIEKIMLRLRMELSEDDAENLKGSTEQSAKNNEVRKAEAIQRFNQVFKETVDAIK